MNMLKLLIFYNDNACEYVDYYVDKYPKLLYFPINQ